MSLLKYIALVVLLAGVVLSLPDKTAESNSKKTAELLKRLLSGVQHTAQKDDSQKQTGGRTLQGRMYDWYSDYYDGYDDSGMWDWQTDDWYPTAWEPSDLDFWGTTSGAGDHGTHDYGYADDSQKALDILYGIVKDELYWLEVMYCGSCDGSWKKRALSQLHRRRVPGQQPNPDQTKQDGGAKPPGEDSQDKSKQKGGMRRRYNDIMTPGLENELIFLLSDFLAGVTQAVFNEMESSSGQSSFDYYGPLWKRTFGNLLKTRDRMNNLKKRMLQKRGEQMKKPEQAAEE